MLEEHYVVLIVACLQTWKKLIFFFLANKIFLPVSDFYDDDPLGKNFCYIFYCICDPKSALSSFFLSIKFGYKDLGMSSVISAVVRGR